MDHIRKVLEQSLFEYKPVKLIFSNPRKKSLPYRKVTLRPVILQCRMMYQALQNINMKRKSFRTIFLPMK